MYVVVGKCLDDEEAAERASDAECAKTFPGGNASERAEGKTRKHLTKDNIKTRTEEERKGRLQFGQK